MEHGLLRGGCAFFRRMEDSMSSLFRLGFLAALLAVMSFAFVPGAFAQEDEGKAEKKMDCAYCQAVHDVCNAVRCDGCADADEACDHCAGTAEKILKIAMCEKCAEGKGDGACGDCTKALAKTKGCAFCAAKKSVAAHTYCSAKCKSAKNEKCDDCKKMREAVTSAKCKDCAAKKKA